MKNKLLFFLLVLFAPVILYNFYYPANPTKPFTEPLPYTDKFLIGVMDSYIAPYLPYYDEAGFNSTHRYITGETGQYPGNSSRHTPKSDFVVSNEHLFDAVPAGDIQSTISDMYSHNGSRFIWQRPKIEWLCFGQSSVYKTYQEDPDYWFYSFGDIHGQPFEDEQWNHGKKVLHCSRSFLGTGAKTVVQKLRANTEQSRRIVGNNEINHWAGDSECDWFVKPRIRADATFINNPNNDEVEICKIYVIMNNGTTQKTVTPATIRAKHFRQFGQQYGGGYIEEFYFNQTIGEIPQGLKFTGDLIADTQFPNWVFNARGDNLESAAINHADIQVEWLDNCEMWIDYVKVENDIADGLMNPNNPLYTTYNDWITDEANAINQSPYVYNFYTELTEFNNIPCMAYVNKKIDAITGGKINYMSDHMFCYQYHMPWYAKGTIDTPGKMKKMFFDKTGIKQIFMGDPYPVTSTHKNGCYHYNGPQYGRIPNTLPIHDPNNPEIYALDVDPAEYDFWLQNRLDTSCAWYLSGTTFNEYEEGLKPNIYRGIFSYLMKRGNAISKSCDIPFIPMIQNHHWVSEGELDREPTIEEHNLMTNLAVSYGAKGIMFYQMPSFVKNSCEYSYGLIGTNGQPRTANVYNQPKWDSLKRTNERLRNWGQTLMSFDNKKTNSYIYRLDDEREACRQNEYFTSIATYYRGNAYNSCLQDYPGFPPYDGLIYDCAEETYLQAATFENSSERNTNYFMIVNRRCSPLQPVTHNDGERFIRLHFDSDHAELNGANNWKVTDVVSGWDTVFNKLNSAHVVNLGWFNPGEGRLYKMTPLPNSGGVLAGDEVITGESFTCEDTIFSNGYNITIGAGTTMKFTDSSCIVMNGGVFTMGDQQVSGPQNITFDAASGSSWHGHTFTGTEVHIYGASFTGLANDSVYVLNMINCPIVDIRNTAFNTAGSLKGAINAVYYVNDESATVNFYIGGNTFTATGSTIPTVNVSSFAGVTTPLIIENNTFTNGNAAIFLSGVTGGAVKNNNISENYTGISLLSSYIDVSGNTISSSVNGSTGIFAAGGSEVKMNPAGPKKFGGMNSISNEGTGTNNIKVEGSYFLTDGGQNVFNISDISTSYHLYGYFPQYIAIPYDETMNCFKISGSPTNTPYNLVTDGYQGSQITFNFYPLLAGCDPEQGDNMMVLGLGNGIYDTVYSNGSGSGGSQSSALPLSKGEYSRATGREGVYYKQTTPSVVRREAFTPPNVNTAYDSICMLMRYRNYPAARTKCLEMITNYPDSIHSLNALAKLYLASVSSNANITDLKVFYENLILNHPNNTSLVKRANYYILKCKVRLHEYTSALAGFQQIINENPYSYEGLIAKWDYMATSLLVPGGGGEPMISDWRLRIADLKAEELEAEDRETEDREGNPNSEFRDPNSTDDKSPFTKEQRIDIRKSINTAIESDKNDNDRKIRSLETRSDQGDMNAIKELAQVKALKQVVKTEKPGNITEHIRLVSEDIQKVFGNITGGKGKDMSNIPTVYRLSQNYPNPFNPVTKINYDLPKDAKVNIVIYDILGREVKRLVNNELKTVGTYIIDFNAANYASGVYFYRIEAEEPGGNKFVDSKKMVLLK